MTLSVHTSWIVYVDFIDKKVVFEVKEDYSKIDLLQQGLIDFKRLVKHAKVHVVEEKEAS